MFFKLDQKTSPLSQKVQFVLAIWVASFPAGQPEHFVQPISLHNCNVQTFECNEMFKM